MVTFLPEMVTFLSAGSKALNRKVTKVTKVTITIMVTFPPEMLTFLSAGSKALHRNVNKVNMSTSQ
jgi:hypothetical protein